MNKQSKNQKKELSPMKLYLMNMNEIIKHELFRNIGHLSMT
ncbi:11491_t:CDS:2 [Ambispora leptoticha]|uniref:11491_t:CDS:1 n=1 Tax=Ambispora leptoticha TaxID=144679 RepID=A0A9N8ZR29_9GLOM|nr:11491_t:CDS:2 [Ambispora leptoticha]